MEGFTGSEWDFSNGCRLDPRRTELTAVQRRYHPPFSRAQTTRPWFWTDIRWSWCSRFVFQYVRAGERGKETSCRRGLARTSSLGSRTCRQLIAVVLDRTLFVYQ